MEGNSSASTNGGQSSASELAALNLPQASEEPKSSPVPSMSGALQGEDAKDVSTAADDAEGTSTMAPPVLCVFLVLTANVPQNRISCQWHS